MTAPEFDPGDWMGQGVELAGRLVAYIEWLGNSRWRVAGQATAADSIADDLGSILRREWNPIDEPL